MSARVLSGKELAATIRSQVTEQAAALRAAGSTPRLAVVTATDDRSSAWYVSSVSRAADKWASPATRSTSAPMPPSPPSGES